LYASFYVLEAENGFALPFSKNKGEMEINFLARTKLQGKIRFENLLFSGTFLLRTWPMYQTYAYKRFFLLLF
jgi:hypothetical protein